MLFRIKAAAAASEPESVTKIRSKSSLGTHCVQSLSNWRRDSGKVNPRKAFLLIPISRGGKCMLDWRLALNQYMGSLEPVL